MMHALTDDPRLHQVRWKDLCKITPLDTLSEILLPLPWLAGSWALAWSGWTAPALGASFVFFLCALRVNHNACHYALGLPRRGHDVLMFALSGLILGSNHAVQFNHLRHHRFCLGAGDVEARSAHMAWWQALAFGPLFPMLLIATTWRNGHGKARCWLVGELALNALVLVLVFGLTEIAVLRLHYGSMVIGQCLTAFFAVWTVHHDCHPQTEVARTLRNRFKSAIVFDMFYHLEHHLFPRVPTFNLYRLAERLDQALPEIVPKQVY